MPSSRGANDVAPRDREAAFNPSRRDHGGRRADPDRSRVSLRLRDRADGAARRAIRRTARSRNARRPRSRRNPRARALHRDRRADPLDAIQRPGRDLVRRVREGRRLPGGEESPLDDARRDHRGSRKGEPARPRRRGIPRGAEVVLYSQGQPQAEVSGGERGRGRAGDLQGPLHPGAGSPRSPRRNDRRRLHHREPQGVRLHPRRVFPIGEAPRSRRRGSVYEGVARKEHPGKRLRPGRRDPPRRGRLHLRRRDRALELPRGRKGISQAEASLPRDLGALSVPDHREQRRDACLRSVHPEGGRRQVRRNRNSQAGRHETLLA